MKRRPSGTAEFAATIDLMRICSPARSYRTHSRALALMSTDEATIGLGSPFSTWMPYSVSMPQTFGMATRRPYPHFSLKILTGADPLDRPATLGSSILTDERA